MGLPLPPGTSSSWIPPSSLYCTQKSVSRISAAAANRSSAASPRLSLPPLSSGGRSFPRAGELDASRPALMVAAPAAASPPFMNERRLISLLGLFRTCFMGSPLLCEVGGLPGITPRLPSLEFLFPPGRFNRTAPTQGGQEATSEAGKADGSAGRGQRRDR